jgi:hypothetical protein
MPQEVVLRDDIEDFDALTTEVVSDDKTKKFSQFLMRSAWASGANLYSFLWSYTRSSMRALHCKRRRICLCTTDVLSMNSHHVSNNGCTKHLISAALPFNLGNLKFGLLRMQNILMCMLRYLSRILSSREWCWMRDQTLDMFSSAVPQACPYTREERRITLNTLNEHTNAKPPPNHKCHQWCGGGEL